MNYPRLNLELNEKHRMGFGKRSGTLIFNLHFIQIRTRYRQKLGIYVIAATHTPAEVWVAHTEYAIEDKNLEKGFYTIYWIKCSVSFSAGGIQRELNTLK